MFVTLAESLGSLTDKASEPGRWLVDSFPLCTSFCRQQIQFKENCFFFFQCALFRSGFLGLHFKDGLPRHEHNVTNSPACRTKKSNSLLYEILACIPALLTSNFQTAGTCLPCFTRDLLEENLDTPLTDGQEDLFMYASASLYIGMFSISAKSWPRLIRGFEGEPIR
jgi:hypothetical protein